MIALTLVLCLFPTSTIAKIKLPNLKTAAPFAVLGANTITNTGNTILNGNLGVAGPPGFSINGFPPGVFDGTVHIMDPVAQQAQDDAGDAYSNAWNLDVTTELTTKLDNQILSPGIYSYHSPAELGPGQVLSFVGTNSSSDLWVIHLHWSLTIGASASVQLSNGAQGCKIFWVGDDAVTFGPGAAFAGNILTPGAITLGTGASNQGGLYTGSSIGAIDLDDNVVQSSNDLCLPHSSSSSTTASSSTSFTSSSSISSSASTSTSSASTTSPTSSTNSTSFTNSVSSTNSASTTISTSNTGSASFTNSSTTTISRTSPFTTSNLVSSSSSSSRALSSSSSSSSPSSSSNGSSHSIPTTSSAALYSHGPSSLQYCPGATSINYGSMDTAKLAYYKAAYYYKRPAYSIAASNRGISVGDASDGTACNCAGYCGTVDSYDQVSSMGSDINPAISPASSFPLTTLCPTPTTAYATVWI